MLTAQLAEREHRIGRPLAAHFTIVDHEAVLAVRRRAHHREAQRSVGQRGFAQRRVAGGHETDLREPQRLQHLERRAHVPEMDRVEGPAEDPDRHHAARRTPAIRATSASSAIHGSPFRAPFAI